MRSRRTCEITTLAMSLCTTPYTRIALYVTCPVCVRWQFLVVYKELLLNFFLALVAVIVLSFLVLGKPVVVIIVSLTVVSVFCRVCGWQRKAIHPGRTLIMLTGSTIKMHHISSEVPPFGSLGPLYPRNIFGKTKLLQDGHCFDHATRRESTCM